jgi:hypothetical protein
MTVRNFTCLATGTACADDRCKLDFCALNEAEDVKAREVARIAAERRKTSKSREVVNELIKRHR